MTVNFISGLMWRRIEISNGAEHYIGILLLKLFEFLV